LIPAIAPLIDADLSILGSCPATYKRYTILVVMPDCAPLAAREKKTERSCIAEHPRVDHGGIAPGLRTAAVNERLSTKSTKPAT
jgi:hypothetical protein